jgi:hypothetical protein
MQWKTGDVRFFGAAISWQGDRCCADDPVGCLF